MALQCDFVLLTLSIGVNLLTLYFRLISDFFKLPPREFVSFEK